MKLSFEKYEDYAIKQTNNCVVRFFIIVAVPDSVSAQLFDSTMNCKLMGHDSHTNEFTRINVDKC